MVDLTSKYSTNNNMVWPCTSTSSTSTVQGGVLSQWAKSGCLAAARGLTVLADRLCKPRTDHKLRLFPRKRKTSAALDYSRSLVPPDPGAPSNLLSHLLIPLI